MKRLRVCSDGTWNHPDQEDNGIPSPTKVFRIFNAIAHQDSQAGTKQLNYYPPGVGQHITSAFHWLGTCSPLEPLRTHPGDGKRPASKSGLEREAQPTAQWTAVNRHPLEWNRCHS